MDPPSNIEVECPRCGEVCLHQVLKGRLTKGKGAAIVLDATVKCSSCGRVHHVHIRQRRPASVQVIISEGDRSERRTIELPREEEVSLKDEIELDGLVLQVTAIEVGGQRKRRAVASDIDTIWTRTFDKVKVKVSVFRGRQTSPGTIMSAPEEEFGIGDIIEVKGRPAAIEKIKVADKVLRKGSAEARDIVRIYARAVK